MRHVLVGMVVVAAMALTPLAAVADNQQKAEEIATSLRESGQLHGYKIGVKYQDGTAWLRGRVSDQEQMDTAMRLVTQMPGVTRVVNEMTISEDAGATSDEATGKSTLARFLSSAKFPQALQQTDGATAPDQIGRDMTARFGAARLPATESTAAGRLSQARRPMFPAATGRAERLASSFTTAPAQKVSALSESNAAKGSAAPQRGAMYPVTYAQAVGTPQASAPAIGVPQASAPASPLGVPTVPQGEFVVPNGAALPPGAVIGPQGVYQGMPGVPCPQQYAPGVAAGPAGAYDQPYMPNYAWPAYASYPNYAALTYPKQYSPTAWPYIGPFYPYPQVPLGWRKVTLEWHDGWWWLDFDDGPRSKGITGLFHHER